MAEGDPFIKEPNLNNPYVSPEEQDMQMEPHVMGPPSYGSPDPTTSAGSLVPIVDHPLAPENIEGGEENPAAISEDYGADVEAPSEEDDGPNATAGAVELAEENGVDLSSVEGTGSGGRVTKADVENYLASQETE
jgi:pyruvate/2-oxoglutarate dehydrogenase complex dihydrolipoamide acyltransferase (E2) component